MLELSQAFQCVHVKIEERDELFHYSHVITADNRNPDLEFVFAFQEQPVETRRKC